MDPQLIPAGLEVTVPEPPPDFATLSVSEIRLKPAVTDRAWLIVTVQAPVPEQAPDQPEKDEPVAGVALRVTLVP